MRKWGYFELCFEPRSKATFSGPMATRQGLSLHPFRADFDDGETSDDAAEGFRC
ncbi:hypothetical protein ES319_D11G249800v1 [Gossypium barbadense]|uniref:Uncharacterized protein n=1 Tax=Gossypium barbadense TaxID=3634 RepID=A0A5J5PFI8_GOSBA|nr:hypothetical protein ES319_D11G249800v1 [Gossypium barbadense]